MVSNSKKKSKSPKQRSDPSAKIIPQLDFESKENIMLQPWADEVFTETGGFSNDYQLD